MEQIGQGVVFVDQREILVRLAGEIVDAELLVADLFRGRSGGCVGGGGTVLPLGASGGYLGGSRGRLHTLAGRHDDGKETGSCGRRRSWRARGQV